VSFERLELPEVTAYYDEAQRIVFVAYTETLTPDISKAVYEWANRIATSEEVARSRGSIYDFRRVQKFNLGNLTVVQQKSTQLNRKEDFSNHAVALLVDTVYQESMVKTAMQISPGQARKRIVHSMEEALAFVESFHENRRSSENHTP
jgi:hypothetical protein